MKKHFLFAMALSFLLFSCNSDRPVSPDKSVFTVSGRVTQDGNPLQGVTVAAGIRSCVTGNDGMYAITDVPAGTFELTASKSGYDFTPGTLAVALFDANISGKDFSARELTLADFTRCVFEVHGIILTQNSVTQGLSGPANKAVVHDTLDFVFTAKRNRSDMSVLLFDTIAPPPASGMEDFVDTRSLLIRLNTLGHLRDVTYRDVYRSVSKADPIVHIDSSRLSFGPVFSTAPLTYKISGNTLLLTSIINIFRYYHHDSRPVGELHNLDFINYKLTPDAQVIIRLLK